MSEESNKYSEVFERIKTILNNKIKSIEQGSAKEFRERINSAIGTLPEIDAETGHIKKDKKGKYLDGEGMTGAVYAMGDIIDVGLSELDDTLSAAKEATTNASTAASAAEKATNTVSEVVNSAEEVNKLKEDANKALNDANVATDNANRAANNANRAANAVDGLVLEKLLPFFVVAQADESDSYPVGKDENGNKTRIDQVLGALWFKILEDEQMVNTLIDFYCTENTDGTYTITDWKETLNGIPSTTMVVPDNNNIIF